jgi:HlyD family secretion protein
MSTSLGSSATAGGVIAGASVSRASVRVHSGNRRLPVLFGVVAVGAVIVLVWAATAWTRSRVDPSSDGHYVVSARDFSVVLKEKGELKAAKSTEIASEVEGRATIISLVPEGTFVQKDQLLVELASNEIEDRIRQEELKEANAITAFEAAQKEVEIQRDKNSSDIRKAELQIELARLALEKYQKGDWVQASKDAEIAIEQAEINLERRHEDFEAAKKLLERDFITRTEYEEDEFNYQKAVWELDKARQSKEVLEKYSHVADSRQRESDLEEAIKEAERVKKNAEAEEAKKVGALDGKTKELALIQDQLAKLRRQREKCVIKAPTQGFVVYYSGGGGRHFMSDDNQIREGATVFERQVMMMLPDTSEMLVVVRIHEAKTDKLELGQRTSVQVEGLPGKTFSGSVTKIAVVADSQNRWLNPDLKEYETEVRLDQNDSALKPGMTAFAEILVETVEDRIAVPVQAIYAKSGQRYVFQAKGDKAAPVPVQLGAVGSEWAEVVSGLDGGESVLLAFGEEHKRMIPDRPREGRGAGLPNPGLTSAVPAGTVNHGAGASSTDSGKVGSRPAETQPAPAGHSTARPEKAARGSRSATP